MAEISCSISAGHWASYPPRTVQKGRYKVSYKNGSFQNSGTSGKLTKMRLKQGTEKNDLPFWGVEEGGLLFFIRNHGGP